MSGTANPAGSATNLAHWERRLVLGPDLQALVRPIRADDDGLLRDLFAHMSKQDLRLRFFESIKEISPELMHRLTRFDRARAIAFIAISEADGHALGVARLHGDPTPAKAVLENAEFAIAVRSDLKGVGLGWFMMRLIIEHAKSIGLKQIQGQILEENTVMLKMCRELGFEVTTDAGDPGVRKVTLGFKHESLDLPHQQ
jgi:RimJ/RimL family protein N-acetyltransferase